jgi:hypothetical protein
MEQMVDKGTTPLSALLHFHKRDNIKHRMH